MTQLYNDPKTFMEDAIAGFLDVHAATVTGVPGGWSAPRRHTGERSPWSSAVGPVTTRRIDRLIHF